jgi:hypothetical protein
MKTTTLKKTFCTVALLTYSLTTLAGPKITDSRTSGLLYGFLTTIENAQNAGDGVLIVSADLSCSKHKINEQYYCMSDVGGITGDIAKSVYLSFPEETEEIFDQVTVRRGSVGCTSIEESGKAPLFNCF